jgi:hypothetical protein
MRTPVSLALRGWVPCLSGRTGHFGGLPARVAGAKKAGKLVIRTCLCVCVGVVQDWFVRLLI